MGRKKTSWISFHDDTDEKGFVRDLLLGFFGIHALQDEVLYFSKDNGHNVALGEGYYDKESILKKFFVHYPDLCDPYHNPTVVLEIDGDVHWQNSMAVRRTNKRNLHYEMASLRFAWVTAGEVNEAKKRLDRGAVASLVEKISLGLKILPRLPEGEYSLTYQNYKDSKVPAHN